MKMKWWHGALIVSLVIAAILSPFASSWPDGLERVAGLLGFATQAEGSPTVNSPLPDYVFPGIASEGLATAIAGILGTLLVFALLYGVGKVLARGEKTNDGQSIRQQ